MITKDSQDILHNHLIKLGLQTPDSSSQYHRLTYINFPAQDVEVINNHYKSVIVVWDELNDEEIEFDLDSWDGQWVRIRTEILKQRFLAKWLMRNRKLLDDIGCVYDANILEFPAKCESIQSEITNHFDYMLEEGLGIV